MLPFGGSGHYGQITDERDIHMDKCVENKFQKILENSTNIRSESYWHQINCLVKWWQVTKGQVKKIWFGGSRNYRQIMDEWRKNVWKLIWKNLEYSTNIQSESYWHQINCLVDKITGPKKICFGGSGHYGRIMDECDIHKKWQTTVF